jgi:hypothetical protein
MAKIVAELSKNFTKFIKSEELHSWKLEQQRKAPKHDKASRPVQYSENKSRNSYPKHVNNIDSIGYQPPKNWEKNSGPPP